MAGKRWSEVVASPDYLKLSAEDKEAVRQSYFDMAIAPRIPEGEREAARMEFDRTTKTQRSELEPAPSASGGLGEIVSDLGTAAKVGGARAIANLGEVAQQIPQTRLIEAGADAIAARAGLPTHAEHRASLDRKIRDMESDYSADFQAAGKKLWWDEENATFGDAWSDWRAYAKGLTESLPEQVITMFPAIRLAKGAYAMKLAQTGDQVLAAKAAARTAQIVGGVGEGALAGAATSREVRSQIDAMSEADLRKSEAIQALLRQGMSFEQAKRAVIEDAATQAFILAGLGTGLFAGMGDRALAKAMFGGQDKLLARVLKGMVGEGALEEFPQSFGEKLAENVAMRKVDPERSLTKGALNEAFGGLAIGAVQGGAQSALLGRPARADAAGGLPVPSSEVMDEPDSPAPRPSMTHTPARGMTDTENMRNAPPEITETDPGAIDTQLQNRQRDRAVSVAQMAEIAAAPDFDRLADAPIPDVGAPMVSVAGDAEVPGAVLGRASNVTLPDGTKVPVQYAVVEADQVLASHAVNGARSERYFSAPQPGEIRALTNGRVAGLQEAFVRNNTQDYRQKLTARAQEFGLEPQAIANMRAPMLVRVYPDEVNKLPGIGRMSNTGGSARLSPLETAINDSETIRSLDALEFAENGDLNVPANRQFFRAFVQQVIPKQEWPEVMDEAGRLNAAGLARIRNAILVKAFGRSESVLRVLDSADDNVRRITAALVRVAPRVARARELAEAGQLFPIEVIEDVLAAAEEISRLRAEGKTIAQVLAQMTLVDRPYSDDTVEILRFLDDANRAGSRLTAFINGYLDELEKYGPQGEDMFGAKPAPDKGAVARTKIKEVLNEEQRVQGSAASGAAKPAAEPKAGGAVGGTKAEPGAGEPGGPARSEPARAEGGPRGEPKPAPEVKAKPTPSKKQVGGKTPPPAAGLPIQKPTGESKKGPEAAKASKKQPEKAAAAPAVQEKLNAEEQAKADLQAALGDLGDILGKNVKKNITPEQEQKLLPVLTRLFDAAFRLGYVKFKGAARFVRDEIRKALGGEVEDLLTIDHYQGAYIGMAGKYRAEGIGKDKLKPDSAADVARITDKAIFSGEGFAGLLKKEGEVFNETELRQAWSFMADFPQRRSFDDALAALEREYAENETKLKAGMPDIPDAGKPGMAETYARRARLVRALIAWAKENRDELDRKAEPTDAAPATEPQDGQTIAQIAGEEEIEEDEPPRRPETNAETAARRKANDERLQRGEMDRSYKDEFADFSGSREPLKRWRVPDEDWPHLLLWDWSRRSIEDLREAVDKARAFELEEPRQRKKGRREPPRGDVQDLRSNAKALMAALEWAEAGGARKYPIDPRLVKADRDAPADFWTNEAGKHGLLRRYLIDTPKGKVQVDIDASDFVYEQDDTDFGTVDIELHGLSISETGYRSMLGMAWDEIKNDPYTYAQEIVQMRQAEHEQGAAARARSEKLAKAKKQKADAKKAQPGFGFEGFDKAAKNKPTEAKVDAAAAEAAASPANDRPAPSTPQAEAGNYKMGHVRLHGLDISIETPAQAWRHSYDTQALTELEREAKALSMMEPARHSLIDAMLHFRNGEVELGVRSLEGAEKSATNTGRPQLAERIRGVLDAGWHVRMPVHYGYIKRTEGADGDHVDIFIGPQPENGKVWIINQNHPGGGFDEHKVMLGFASGTNALVAYKDSFADGWGDRVFGSISKEMTVEELKADLPKLKKAKAVAPAKGGRTIDKQEAQDGQGRPGSVQRRAKSGVGQGDLFAAPAGAADSRPLVPDGQAEGAPDGARGDAARPAEGAVRGGNAEPSGERQPGLLASGGPREDGAVRPAARPVKTPAVLPPANYTITAADNLGSGGAKTKFRDNLAAIRLVKELQAEQRRATPEEQKILVRYVGWGGLKEAFDPDNDGWATERKQLAEVLSKEELDAARRSVQDAHYTSETVIRGLYEGLARLGVKGNARVLEPSVGIGHFFGLMPESLRGGVSLFGVELDPTSAAIAKQLYQKAEIINRGLQDVPIPSEYFDLAIGNPPFGEQRITDESDRELSGKTIHNYFFAKSMKTLRPGGILAMVVSRYYMDKAAPADREAMNYEANFLGGIRLPNTAFKQNARTEVTTDILFFQKRHDQQTVQRAARWIDTSEVRDPETGDPIRINRYFADNPAQMLGTMTLAGSMYREGEPTLEPRQGQDLAEGIRAALERLPENAYTEIPDEQRVSFQYDTEGVVPSDAKIDAYFLLPDGSIARRLADQLAFKRFEKVAADGRAADRIKGLINVRSALGALMEAELQEATSELRLSTLRTALNSTYDAFRRRYGFINDRANRLAFRDDPSLPLLESLEPKYQPAISKEVAARAGTEPRAASAEKADIFRRRVLAPWKPPTKADSAKEALVHSLNMRGAVDLDYMAELYGKDPAAIASELSGVIYLNPEGGWETSEQYLSGNVKAKLQQARVSAATDSRFEENVVALEKVIPPDIEALDINVSLGSPWVPTEDMKDFVQNLLGVRPSEFKFMPQVGSWAIGIRWVANEAFTATWGTKRMYAHDIIAHLANGEAVIVYDTVEVDGKEKRVKNEKETEAAQVKADEVARAFKDWIWTDADRRARLARLYNDTYNTNRTREYDGSHLTFPGMSPAVQLRRHQRGVVWRILQDRVVLEDHVVGAGKTYATAAAVMEAKRLGIAKKQMLVVPNHLVRQWRDEFYRLYPNANILVPSEKDFEKKNRQRLFGKIATNDWDAVIVAHSSFLKIEPPRDAAGNILAEQIADIEQAVKEMKGAKADNRNAVRQLEKMKEKLYNKMRLLNAKAGARDQVVDLEQMGVDALMVDEMHEFKNLFYHTKMQRVAGLGTPMGSGKAFDLFVKVRFLAQRFGGKAPIIGATGTPVSNSLVEMFTMQRYMMYDELKRRSIHHLDSWAKVFGNVANVYEVHPSGQGYRLSTRFAKFVNLPELMTLYKSFADVITMKDLKAQAEAEGKVFPVPKVKGGKPQNVVAERSPQQVRFFGEEVPEEQRERGIPYTPGSILWRIENLKNVKDPREDNMLKITNDARKAGLDFRLIDPGAADFPGSKQNILAGHVKRIYDAWGADRGTQLIFCDLSIPSSARGKEGERFAIRTVSGVRIVRGRRVAIEGAPEELEFILEKLTKPGTRTLLGYRVLELHTGREIAGEEKSAAALAAAAKALQDDAMVRELIAEAVASEDVSMDEAEHDPDAPPEDDEEAVGVDELMAQASPFSVYDDVRDKLIALGIPAEEIGFIHDYDTAEKKKKLFAAMNAGTLRVLMGSTFKMGAGMNVQERLVAEHNLDAPWRPSDLEQREGRIIRHGNRLYERDPDGFEVELIRYATNQTYDTRMWQLIEHKASGVEQLRKGDNNLREIEDISGEAANASEMKAAASGNPLILEEVTLRTEVKRLEAEEYAHKRTRHTRQDRLSRIESDLKFFERRLSRVGTLRAAMKPKEPFAYLAPDGKAVAEKKDAAGHLLGGIGAAIKSQGQSHYSLGQYRGLFLYAKRGFGSVGIEGALKGSDDYFDVTRYEKDEQFSAVGFFARVDNWIDGLENREKQIVAENERDRKEAEGIRGRLDEPFAKAAELAEKRARHQKVTQALKAGKKTLDEAPPPDDGGGGAKFPADGVSEPGAVYNVAYEGVPEDQGADRSGSRAEAPSGARTVRDYPLDLWISEGRPHGERFATTSRTVRVGTLRSGLKRVSGPEDAAHVFAPIRKDVVETGLVLVLDKRKKPLAVLRMGLGSRTQTSIYPGIIASQAHSIPGAASIWFAHNHPSGLPEPSRADELLTRNIADALTGTGVELAGHIVMGGSRAFWFERADTRGITPITKAVRRFKIPEVRFQFAKQAKLAAQPLTSPDAARAMMRTIDDPAGVLLLDAQHNPVAWVPMSTEEMKVLRTRETGTGASRLYQAINNANASAMFVKTATRDDKAWMNMAGFAQTADVRMLDAFYSDTAMPAAMRSAAENGTLPSGHGFFSQLEGGRYEPQAPGGSTVDSVRQELRMEVGAKVERVSVVQSWRELPEEARELVFSRRAFDVQGWTDPKTGNFVLVADNIKPGRAFSVLMHEVGVHMGLRAFIGNEAFDKLAAQVTEWAAFGMGEHGRLAKAALARIPKNTPKKDRLEELVAYFVEEAVKAGHSWHKPERKGAIAKWFEALVKAIATALSKLGVNPGALSVDDVIALARGALEVSLSGHEGRRGKDGLLSVVWHGSPHDFDEFKLNKIGEGEGAQAYGWGLYFASNREVAEFYRNNLAADDVWLRDGQPLDMGKPEDRELSQALNTLATDVDPDRPAGEIIDDAIFRGSGWIDFYGRTAESAAAADKIAASYRRYTDALKANKGRLTLQRGGRLYKVDLAPSEDDYLDWDKPLNQQSEQVKAALRKIPYVSWGDDTWSAGTYYMLLAKELGGQPGEKHPAWMHRMMGFKVASPEAASKALLAAGIPGIRYLDGGSRGKGEGTRNYVIFDDSLVRIDAKFSRGGLFSQSGEDTAPPRRRRRFNPLDIAVRVPVQALKIDRATAAVYDGLIEKVGGFVPEKVKAGVVSDYGLPQAVIDRRDLMFGQQRGQLRRVKNILDRLATLTRAEARVLHQAATTADPAMVEALLDGLPEDSKTTLREIKEWVHEMGMEEVRLGQLSQESFERNEWAYLHRSYEKYEAAQTPQEKASRGRAVRLWADSYKGRGIEDPEGIARLRKANDAWWGRKLDRTKPDFGMTGQKFLRLERRRNRGEGVAVLPGMDETEQRGRVHEIVYWPADEALPARFASWDQDAAQWEARVNRKGRLVLWRDFTPEERKRMGEIDDIRFAMAKTLHLAIHNVEVGRYLEWVANNYAKPDDKLPAGAAKRDASESNFVVFAKDEWVRVPEVVLAGTGVRKYGKLAGLWVPGPIWNDIRHVTGHRYMPLGETYAALLKAWKISKTALSPTVHMNNIMANVVMADWHDVGAGDVLRAFRTMVAAARGDAAAKAHIARFEDAGGTQGLYVLSEIQRDQLAPILDEIEGAMRDAGEVNSLVGLSGAMQMLMSGQWRQAVAAAKESLPGQASAKAVRAMMDLYEGEDRVFRLAAFTRALEDGKTDIEAGKLARKSFLDYQINAPWINLMRSTAFPFISFVYRALPKLAETAARKPWKLLKLWLVVQAANAMGYALSGGDEEEERRLLPEEKAGWVLGFLAPKLVRMPWNDEHDSPVFLDIRRWIPVGDIVDTGQVHSALPILPAMMPGGPLALLAEFLYNTSAFTGRALTKGTDFPVEAVQKVFRHFWRGLAPNFAGVPFVPATDAIVNAGTGETDIFGREYSLRDALLSAIGIKVASYPADVATRNARIEASKALSEIRGNEYGVRQRARRGDINEAERDQLLADEALKRKRIQDAYRRKVGEGLPTD